MNTKFDKLFNKIIMESKQFSKKHSIIKEARKKAPARLSIEQKKANFEAIVAKVKAAFDEYGVDCDEYEDLSLEDAVSNMGGAEEGLELSSSDSPISITKEGSNYIFDWKALGDADDEGTEDEMVILHWDWVNGRGIDEILELTFMTNTGEATYEDNGGEGDLDLSDPNGQANALIDEYVLSDGDYDD